MPAIARNRLNSEGEWLPELGSQQVLPIVTKYKTWEPASKYACCPHRIDQVHTMPVK